MHVALLRGTTADPQGNVSMEHETLRFDVLNQAMAVHSCGGTVIVQVRASGADDDGITRTVGCPEVAGA